MPTTNYSLVRIYYFKGKMTDQGEGRVHMLGTNMSWTDENSQEFTNKVNNLVNAGCTVFTSPPLGQPRDGWDIEEVIRMHIGGDFGPGLIEL